MQHDNSAISEQRPPARFLSVKDLAYCALMTVIIADCSQINIPTLVPFTLQTFGVFCALCILGGKRGTISVLVYIILGAAGLPVFAQFYSGIGVLFMPSGGYITGFLALGIVYWLITNFFGEKLPVKIIALTAGLAVCYTIGTAWFIYAYSKENGAVGIMTALSCCVFPFIIPDAVKMALALYISRRLSKYVKA